jgi:hypothetical protein
MIRATLVTDGSSDIALVRPLEWLCAQWTDEEVPIHWADLRGISGRHPTLQDRLSTAVHLYPCDLLFVHRDAEHQRADLRYEEIKIANNTGRPHVCVVPVRMQEAWLLLDEPALREAAGRPSGTNALNLPPAERWESLPNPKDVLHTALRAASGASGRRAKTFRPTQAVHRLADLVTDWSPLRRLSAFRRLENDVKDAFQQIAATGSGHAPLLNG